MKETSDPLNQQSLEGGALERAAKDADLADIVERLGVPPLWPRRASGPGA